MVTNKLNWQISTQMAMQIRNLLINFCVMKVRGGPRCRREKQQLCR